MKLIAITPENDFERQDEFICKLLDSGFDYVHIRKPAYTADDMRRLLDKLPQYIHKRLKLHSHFDLANEYGIGGLHINHRWHNIPVEVNDGIRLSKSCHSIDELKDCSKYEYVFLSPIYDSISKKGYRSNFMLDQLAATFNCHKSYNNVIALGGIEPVHLKELEKCGFAGAAFLGYIFNSVDMESLDASINIIRKSL